MLHYSAICYLLYPFELLFVFLAQVCVLYRMRLFSNSSLSMLLAPRQRLCDFCMARLCRPLVAGILLGIGGNITAAVVSQAADFNTEALKALLSTTLLPSHATNSRPKSPPPALSQPPPFSVCRRQPSYLMLIAVYCIVGIRSYRVIAAALHTLLVAEQKFVSSQRLWRQASILAAAAVYR